MGPRQGLSETVGEDEQLTEIAYLMAVEAFNSFNRRLGILEGIARGERAIAEGRVVAHAEAKKRMARWLR